MTGNHDIPSPENSPQEEENFPEHAQISSTEVTQCCTKITERFRAGEFSKSTAILVRDLSFTRRRRFRKQHFCHGFRSYIFILHGFKCFRDTADLLYRSTGVSACKHGEDNPLGNHTIHIPHSVDRGHAASPTPSKRSHSPSLRSSRRLSQSQANTDHPRTFLLSLPTLSGQISSQAEHRTVNFDRVLAASYEKSTSATLRCLRPHDT